MLQSNFSFTIRLKFNRKRLFSDARGIVNYVPTEQVGLLKAPVSDAHITTNILKWRQFVAKRKLCPFVNNFGSKFAIQVERSQQSEAWMYHTYKFLENSDLNTMLIVLPSLLVPSHQHREYVMSLPNSMILPMMFGPEFIKFRESLLNRQLRCMSKDSPNPIIDVGFHPLLGGPNWAPWPVIQLVKSKIMNEAENWYEVTNKCPISKIVHDNATTFHDIFKSKEATELLFSEQHECYTC